MDEPYFTSFWDELREKADYVRRLVLVNKRLTSFFLVLIIGTGIVHFTADSGGSGSVDFTTWKNAELAFTVPTTWSTWTQHGRYFFTSYPCSAGCENRNVPDGGILVALVPNQYVQPRYFRNGTVGAYEYPAKISWQDGDRDVEMSYLVGGVEWVMIGKSTVRDPGIARRTYLDIAKSIDHSP